MLGESVFPAAALGLLGQPDVDQGTEISHNVDEVSPRGLSARETVILRCLMQGDSNKLIARRFDITEATVKVHVKAILRKIHAKNRTQAAIWAAAIFVPSGKRLLVDAFSKIDRAPVWRKQDSANPSIAYS